MKIDGKQIAKETIETLKSKETPKKILAAVLVGNDPQSESFLRRKQQTAEELLENIESPISNQVSIAKPKTFLERMADRK